MAQMLNYATPNLRPRIWRVVPDCVLGIFVSAVTIFVNLVLCSQLYERLDARWRTENSTLLVLCLCEAGASILLAALLFAGAVATTVPSRLGLIVHKVYALSKFVLAGIALWSYALLLNQVGAMRGEFWVTWCAVAVMGLAYPVVVWIATRESRLAMEFQQDV